MKPFLLINLYISKNPNIIKKSKYLFNKKIQNNISKKIEGLTIDPELKRLFNQLQLAKEIINSKLKEIFC